MKEDRRKQISVAVAQNRQMTMDELCSQFGVSINTIRADVAYLVKSGIVEKVYGGVRAIEQKEVPLFVNRINVHNEQKKRIAAAAERLIEDGDILFVDAGTTTMHLLTCLDPDKHITVVTDNLAILPQISQLPNVEGILLPGTVNRRTNSVSDVSTLEYLTRYRFNKAFMGVTGVSMDGRLNVSTYIEYEIKRAAVAQSQQAFLLVDASKFGSTGLISYGQLDQMKTVITNVGCPEYVKTLCMEQNVPILLE